MPARTRSVGSNAVPSSNGARVMNERTERQLAAWLMEGPDRGPTEGLERVLALTRQTRQRPSWTFPERWIPMQLAIPRTAFVIPRGAVLLVVAVLLLLATLWIAGVGRSPRLPAPIGLAGNGLLAIDGGGRITVLSTDGSVKRV